MLTLTDEELRQAYELLGKIIEDEDFTEADKRRAKLLQYAVNDVRKGDFQ